MVSWGYLLKVNLMATLPHDNKQPDGPLGLIKIDLGSVGDVYECSVGALSQVSMGCLG